MGLFNNVSNKMLLEKRKDIFVKSGMPALNKKGFEKAPFSAILYGRNNIGGYSYELCRVSAGSNLEMIKTHVNKGDRWIQIFLNVFTVHPDLQSVRQLKDVDGMQFHLPPNSITEMRLRSDDFKGITLFNFKKHKLHSFFTESGFQKRVDELGDLIEDDMNNIDSFVKRWHELHKPMVTTWDGKA